MSKHNNFDIDLKTMLNYNSVSSIISLSKVKRCKRNILADLKVMCTSCVCVCVPYALYSHSISRVSTHIQCVCVCRMVRFECVLMCDRLNVSVDIFFTLHHCTLSHDLAYIVSLMPD